MSQAAFSIGLATSRERVELSGLEFVEAMGAGRLPMPPMSGVIPTRPHAWRVGEVEFRAEPEDRFANPMGTTHGGWSLTQLDTVMAIAACTTLEKGQGFTTLETSAKFVRAITPRVGELRLLGHVINRGRTIITLEGRIEDLTGRIYAHGTSTVQVLKLEGLNS
jgi:uncharacterized protein (TIGR00369 family)